MKKMIMMGRSECGKTTLRQALKGSTIQYEKTQYVNHFDVIIDTPGEYAETNSLARALALYSYEADVVALVLSATEPYSLYPPNIAPLANRPVIGTVTKTDAPGADAEQAGEWPGRPSDGPTRAGGEPIHGVPALYSVREWMLPVW